MSCGDKMTKAMEKAKVKNNKPFPGVVLSADMSAKTKALKKKKGVKEE